MVIIGNHGSAAAESTMKNYPRPEPFLTGSLLHTGEAYLGCVQLSLIDASI